MLRTQFIRYTLLFSLAVTLSGCTEAVSFVAGVGTGIVIGQVLNVGDWFGGNDDVEITSDSAAPYPTTPGMAAASQMPGMGQPPGGFAGVPQQAQGFAGVQQQAQGFPPAYNQNPYGAAPQQQPQFYAPPQPQQQQPYGMMPPAGGYQQPAYQPAPYAMQPMGIPAPSMAPSYQGVPTYQMPPNAYPLPPAALTMN